MYHWTVPIIIVVLIFSYAIPGWCVSSQRKWNQIGTDLNKILEILNKTKYSNYNGELKLYTAGLGSTDTCEKSILYCYVQELKAVVEEVTLIGDEDAAQNITDRIYNIEINGGLYPLQNGSYKKCEEYEEKSIEEFMEDFENLIKKMINQ